MTRIIGPLAPKLKAKVFAKTSLHWIFCVLFSFLENKILPKLAPVVQQRGVVRKWGAGGPPPEPGGALGAPAAAAWRAAAC